MTNPARQPDTNPSIFLRLNRTDTDVRELAWNEFHECYARVISTFARQFGVQPADVDDVQQGVLLGFYATSPAFVYDPGKRRFRGYLKRCTLHAVQRRLGREAKFRGTALEQVDPELLEVEQAWNDVWEPAQLRRAVEDLRQELGTTKTVRAFESTSSSICRHRKSAATAVVDVRDMGAVDRLIKARPAGAGVELRLRGEQRQPAQAAGVRPLLLVVEEVAAERWLGAVI